MMLFNNLSRAASRSPLIIASAILAVQLASPASAQEYKQIKRLGTSEAICKPAISSGAELQAFFANQRDDVMKILADSGWDGDPADLFQAVEAGHFSQQSYPVGSRVEWMGRRIKGKPMAQPYIEWAGPKPFETFELDFVSNCKAHRMIVPNACCNVSLVSSTPVDAIPEPTLNVEKGEDGSITVTAFAPANSTVEVILTRPDGTREALPLDENGAWTGTPEAGEYNLSATATDPCGTSAPAVVPLAIAAPKRRFWPYVAPFIGRQVRDYDPFLVGVEGGIQFPLSDKFALFGQVGGSYNTDDSELSTYADIGGDFLFEKGFVGLGIGIWDIDDNGTRDNTLLIHGGGDTPWTAGSSTVQWFAEGRIFEDATYVPDNNILKLGLRFIWK